MAVRKCRKLVGYKASRHPLEIPHFYWWKGRLADQALGLGTTQHSRCQSRLKAAVEWSVAATKAGHDDSTHVSARRIRNLIPTECSDRERAWVAQRRPSTDLWQRAPQIV